MKDCQGGIEKDLNGYRGSESPFNKAGPVLRAQPPGWEQPGELCLQSLLKSSTHKSPDLMEPGTEKGQAVVRVRNGCLEHSHRF